MKFNAEAVILGPALSWFGFEKALEEIRADNNKFVNSERCFKRERETRTDRTPAITVSDRRNVARERHVPSYVDRVLIGSNAAAGSQDSVHCHSNEPRKPAVSFKSPPGMEML
jgi:hypothetical protein